MRHTHENLQDLAWDYQVDGYERIAYTFSHVSRWAVYYNLIFRHDGKYWRIRWGEAATESQESPMWEEDYAVVEVEPTTVRHTIYVTVEP